MNIKNVIIFFLIIAGLIGMMWWASKKQPSAPTDNELQTKSELTATSTIYDFGTISMAAGKVSRIFTAINGTKTDILVPSLTTSCMCTSAYINEPDGSKKGPFGMPGMGYVPKADETIKAGESKNIEVVYDPAAHGPAGVGAIDRYVYLVDSNGGTLQFEIKAVVTP